jgi:hypothetical protein
MCRDNKSEWCPSLKFTTLGKGERVNFSFTATSTKSTHPTILKLAVGAAPFCNSLYTTKDEENDDKLSAGLVNKLFDIFLVFQPSISILLRLSTHCVSL